MLGEPECTGLARPPGKGILRTPQGCGVGASRQTSALLQLRGDETTVDDPSWRCRIDAVTLDKNKGRARTPPQSNSGIRDDRLQAFMDDAFWLSLLA